MLIDCFAHGGWMTPAKRTSAMKEIFGPDIEWSDELLQPASNRTG